MRLQLLTRHKDFIWKPLVRGPQVPRTGETLVIRDYGCPHFILIRDSSSSEEVWTLFTWGLGSYSRAWKLISDVNGLLWVYGVQRETPLFLFKVLMYWLSYLSLPLYSRAQGLRTQPVDWPKAATESWRPSIIYLETVFLCTSQDHSGTINGLSRALPVSSYICISDYVEMDFNQMCVLVLVKPMDVHFVWRCLFHSGAGPR